MKTQGSGCYSKAGGSKQAVAENTRQLIRRQVYCLHKQNSNENTRIRVLELKQGDRSRQLQNTLMAASSPPTSRPSQTIVMKTQRSGYLSEA